jgi:hypothetical protein
MKRSDIIFIAVFIAVFAPFFLFGELYEFFKNFTTEWAFTASFIKFALLATMGEMLGHRIRTGRYTSPGFGLLPRALVWGFLGMTVKAAFLIFGAGVPSIAGHLGMTDTPGVMSGGVTASKVLLAFSISFFLNVFYAPVLMVTHRVSDLHIGATGGTLKGFFTVPDIAGLLRQIDWKTMWGFVLKKTIPLFWIPAQTVTFLLPAEFQILFAAILSTVLGVILAFAAGKK